MRPTPGFEGWPPAPTVLPAALAVLAVARIAVVFVFGFVFVWAFALALIASALTYAGHVWGRGRAWARLPFVSRHHHQLI